MQSTKGQNSTIMHMQFTISYSEKFSYPPYLGIVLL